MPSPELGPRDHNLPPKAPQLESPLSNAEISRLMQERGFPELNRCWSDYLKLKAPAASDIADEEVQKERVRHMTPLLGAPKTAAAVSLAAASAASSTLAPSIDELSRPLPDGARPLVHAAYTLNMAVLLAGAVMAFQRYILYPYKKIMARDAASMLRWRDYRASVRSSRRGDAAQQVFNSLGITSSWDNSKYAKTYRYISGTVEEVRDEPLAARVQSALREVLGFKDQEQRRHVPGRLSGSLLEGKRSINSFVAHYQAQLNAVKSGEISCEEVQVMLSDLRDNYCLAGSPAIQFLSAVLSGLSEDGVPPEGQVRARVWQRDPWVDLTSQKEFFSSASLRSSSLFETGSKGRLGTFGYLRNPAICCLDFTTRKGRSVRARMLAAQTRDAEGKAVSVLLVDGVEGTNSVRPAIICHAIENYARECGFKLIAYNAAVHNLTPRLLVAAVAATHGKPKEIKVECLDCSSPEYLDAFGLPLQPFEYRLPKGRVLAHLVPVTKAAPQVGSAPSFLGALHRFMQKKILYLFFADAVAFAALAAAQVSLSACAALAGFAGAGLAANEWYKRRSRRAER